MKAKNFRLILSVLGANTVRLILRKYNDIIVFGYAEKNYKKNNNTRYIDINFTTINISFSVADFNLT